MREHAFAHDDLGHAERFGPHRAPSVAGDIDGAGEEHRARRLVEVVPERRVWVRRRKLRDVGLHGLRRDPGGTRRRVRAHVDRAVVVRFDVDVVQTGGPFDRVAQDGGRVLGGERPEQPVAADLAHHLAVVPDALLVDEDRHQPAAGALRRIDRDRTVVREVRAERPHRSLREPFGDLAGLGESVEHRVAHLVDRTCADRVVGGVADHLEPGFVEQRRRPRFGGEQQRAQRLCESFQRPLGDGGGATYVGAVRRDSHEEVGACSRAQLALPGRQALAATRR